MSTAKNENGDKAEGAVAVVTEKPSLTEYLAECLPFKLPNIPLPQTAKNLDKAVAKIVLSGAERAVNWVERRSSIKDAKADAQIDLIRKGVEVVVREIDQGNSDLAERAVFAAYGRMFQSQENRERIVEHAANELEREPGSTDATDAIDADWLNAFSDKASGVSNEQMQVLWGRLLAGEIRNPGTFKLRTLQALTLVDTTEAKLIHESMNLVVDGTALYIGRGNDRKISFGRLLELQSADVIQGVGSSLSITFDLQLDDTLLIGLAGDHGLFLECETREELRLMNVCPLTAFGRELFRLARVDGPSDGLAESVAQELARAGVTITLAQIVPIPGSEGVSLNPLKQLHPKTDALP